MPVLGDRAHVRGLVPEGHARPRAAPGPHRRERAQRLRRTGQRSERLKAFYPRGFANCGKNASKREIPQRFVLPTKSQRVGGSLPGCVERDVTVVLLRRPVRVRSAPTRASRAERGPYALDAGAAVREPGAEWAGPLDANFRARGGDGRANWLPAGRGPRDRG